MKTLVTGGAGFIGSALIRHIITATAHQVVNVDKLTYAADPEALSEVADNDRYAFERVDICDRAELDRVFSAHQPGAVMHLAAETHVDRSIEGSAAFIQSNLVGSWTLLEASLQHWRQLDQQSGAKFRFHQVSTDEVYGDLGADAEPVDERAAYAPSSPYAATKAGADHLVRAWHRTYGLPVVLSNSANNYGPYQYPEKLIPVVVSKALAGETIPVYGSGEQVRDWLYVDDHVRALMLVLNDGHTGETYNIGGNCAQRNIDVVRAVCRLLDEARPRDDGKSYQALIESVTDRPGHDWRYALDARRIEHDLGWRALESFETGLRKTVHWYLHAARQ